eukprot:4996482-Pyramimonas_sp.AAC.1
MGEGCAIHAKFKYDVKKHEARAFVCTMTDSRHIVASGSELLSLANYFADALRTSGASTLHPPWAARVFETSRRRIAPPVAYGAAQIRRTSRSCQIFNASCSANGRGGGTARFQP